MSLIPVSGLIVSTADQVAPPSVVLYRPRSPPADQRGPCAATYTVLLLRGSIRILPMCSEAASPMRVHVRPASVDLYTPSPKCALRWLVFSPDPTQTTFESFGSTTTQQSVKEPCSSKTGTKVMPRLTVFHNPPNALATYHTLGFFGSISTS
jgi:hypothetical protein